MTTKIDPAGSTTASRLRLGLGLGIVAVIGLTALAVGAALTSVGLLTTREFWFMVHLSFGVVIVHAFAGGLGTMLKSKASPLNYPLLAELNTRPRTTYLAVVRNPNMELGDELGVSLGEGEGH